MISSCYEAMHRSGLDSTGIVQIVGRSKASLLFMGPDVSGPVAVAKIFESSALAERARAEVAALERIRAVADLIGAPRLLGHGPLQPVGYYTLQTGLPGRPPRDELGLASPFVLIRQLLGAESWLRSFHDALRLRIDLHQAVVETTSACRTALAVRTGEEDALLDWVEAQSVRLHHWSASPVHGDFWPGNILYHRGTCHVIDWETLTSGSPIEDLHAYYAGAIARGSSLRGDTVRLLWNAYYGNTRPARLLRIQSARILDRHGIDASVSHVLFGAFLVGRLAAVSFALHSVWRAFVVRFMREGMPRP